MKKGCFTLNVMFNYIDVLEQFNMEIFNIDVLDCIVFLLFFFILIGLYLYDIWLGLSFFVLINFYYLFSSSTSVFIILIYFFLGIGFIFELISPMLEVGYFIFAIITDFILSKTREHLGGKLKTYYIFLVGTTVILGFFNIVGLLPYTTALTGQFIFAFYISIMYFITNLIYGILYHTNKIFNLFLPKGVPLFIIPVLIIIEAISFFSRVLSLAIRLFANIVAGHILLKILVSFLNVILIAHLSFGFPFLIALIGLLIIVVLEVFISILQVYIFNLLLLIYINGVLDIH